ncbi:MAG: DUF1993 domain-containing protein [Proteobacteria bacterium]|nr:DUF1993 domain-containing protein [Pseudomonadota bacterium]
MKISLQTMAVDTFVPMLRNLLAVLDKGVEFAKEKKIDPESLLEERLAPDMFPLGRQIHIACMHAKDATARLSGQEIKSDENTERTLADYRARIERTIAAVQGAKPASFEGADDRAVEFPLIENLGFKSNGYQYFRDWALPQFYFHVVTAYDILRAKGVQIGKRDFMGHSAGPHIGPRSK